MSLPILRNKVESANSNEEDIAILQTLLAEYIGEELDESSMNKDLFEDCLKKADGELVDEKDSSNVILWAAWEKLKQTHRLRVAD
jgi:hypothetical protein